MAQIKFDKETKTFSIKEKEFSDPLSDLSKIHLKEESELKSRHLKESKELEDRLKNMMRMQELEMKILRKKHSIRYFKKSLTLVPEDKSSGIKSKINTEERELASLKDELRSIE